MMKIRNTTMINRFAYSALLSAVCATAQADPIDTKGMFTLFGTQVSEEVDLKIPGIPSTTVNNGGVGLEWTKYPVPFIGLATYANFGLDTNYVFGVNLQPTYFVNDMVSIFGKLGYNYTSIAAADGGSMSYGAGINLDLYKGYGINAQYNQLYSDTHFSISSVDIGLSIKY